MPRTMTVPQAAEALGIPKSTLYQAIRENRAPHLHPIRIGNTTRIPTSVVDRLTKPERPKHEPPQGDDRMIVSSTLRQAFTAWSRNPTNRNRARLVGALARMDEEMHRRGMADVFYEDAGMSCPRELRAILEFYKVWEGHEFAAA